MVRIRPAFAYLRTSFPSTSLQDSASLGWDNMLLSDSKRSIPVVPDLPILGGHFQKRDKQRLEINEEIDKQFWQKYQPRQGQRRGVIPITW